MNVPQMIMRSVLWRHAMVSVVAALLVSLSITAQQTQNRGQKTKPVPKAEPPSQESAAKDSAPAAPKAAGAQNLALVIGVSKYQNLPEAMQLNYADKDAQSLADFLAGPQGGFSRENVVLLTNEGATRANILEQLGRLRDSPKESLVLIYFAGHGEVWQARQEGSEQGFLLPYDTQIEAPDATAVQMDAFNNIVRKIRSRSVVVITDACKSGAIGDLANRPNKGRGIATKDIAEADANDYQSSFILTAASPLQSSLEVDELKHGVFTYHLLGGLQGAADQDRNGIVTAGELFGYVRARVTEYTEKRQTPESNVGYDTTIPLSILNDPGLAEYGRWFESDPLVSRWVSGFDEALRENRLTRPEGMSAWTFYKRLFGYHHTPHEVITRKRAELTRRLTEGARAKIDETPRTPAEWEVAAEWFDKANDLLLPDKDPKLRMWFAYSRGMFRFYSEEMKPAAREFDSVLESLEEHRLEEPMIAAKIGAFYKQQGRLEEARRAYKLATAGRPQEGWRREYAKVLIDLDRWDEAKTELRTARVEWPDDVSILRLLAETLLRASGREELAEAAQVAEQAHKLAPDDIELEDLYGRTLLKAGQIAQAIAPLRKIAERYLTDAGRRDQKLLQLSQAYLQNADVGRAVSALREAERHESKSVEVYDMLARLLYEQGELDRATAAAQKAATLSPGKEAERAKRHLLLATYHERAGRLKDAALEYKNAADLSFGDGRVKAAIETHSQALFYRTGDIKAEARSAKERPVYMKSLSIIAPGGREALERLTGVNIDESNERQALARIFEVCLRETEVRSRLITFFEQYPEFIRRAERKGSGIGQVELPPPGASPVSEETRDILRFFGASDNKGRRQIDRQDFNRRKGVLTALGGDPERLERGEAVTIKWRSDQLPIFLGLESWVYGKEGIKAREEQGSSPSNVWLYLLRDEDRMKLYAGASLLPPEVAQAFLMAVSLWGAEDRDRTNAFYFTAPYLQFSPQGQLVLPGGERIWQESLKRFTNSIQLVRSLYLKENGGLLYLFAALSAAGPVGERIASSGYFKQLSRMMQQSPLPAAREKFDFMDLLSHLRLEGRDSLRLPQSAELWLGAAPDSDVFSALLARIGRTPAGKSIQAARQIAALAQIERERPEWVADLSLVNQIANQVIANRETLLEVALDLDMSAKQLERFLSRAATLDASAAPTERLANIRADQSAFELMRALARNGSLDEPRAGALVDRLLSLQPANDLYAFELFDFVRRDLLGETQSLNERNGQMMEDKLIAALAHSTPLVLPAAKIRSAPAVSLFSRFDPTPDRRESIRRALESQEHARFVHLAQAADALDALDASPSDATAIAALKSALDHFALPDTSKDPRRKKPANAPPSLSESVAALSSPVAREKLAELRRQFAPFVGEALLGMIYASLDDLSGGWVAALPSLVRQHDLSANPWGRAEFDPAKKMVRGSIAQLGLALSTQAARVPGGSSVEGKGGEEQFPYRSINAAVTQAQHLIDGRRLTLRAVEYIARSLDLGEDVVGLSAMRIPAAEKALYSGLSEMLSPRRAAAIQQALDQGGVKQAIEMLTPSELYFLGQRYLTIRREQTPLAELANDPGSIGHMARILKDAQASDNPSASSRSLARELRQFGMPVTTRAGLARLELSELEPYERAMSFADASRMAERGQDLKLILARASHRQVSSSALPQTAALVRQFLKDVAENAREAAGGTPQPESDWEGLRLTLAGRLAESSLRAFLDVLGRSTRLQATPDPRWNEK